MIKRQVVLTLTMSMPFELYFLLDWFSKINRTTVEEEILTRLGSSIDEQEILDALERLDTENAYSKKTLC